MKAGHFERTYDGVAWEQISAVDVKDRLAGYYRAVGDIMREMRSKPGMEIRTPFAVYRYTTAQEAR